MPPPDRPRHGGASGRPGNGRNDSRQQERLAGGAGSAALLPTTRHGLPALGATQQANAAFALWSAAAYVRHAYGQRSDDDQGRVTADSKHTAPHFDAVCRIELGPAYAAAHERWKASCFAAGLLLGEVRIAQRLLIGLSEHTLWETGISLAPVYGAPVWHGSALKGLCRSFARQQMTGVFAGEHAVLDEHLVDALFGSERAAGQVQFNEAWWVPGSAPAAYGANRPFVHEVVTPHHKAFIDNRGAVPATPFDSPEPVPQLATHGRFLVALGGARVWAEHALDILQIALEMEGAGARTPEYGRGDVRRLDA